MEDMQPWTGCTVVQEGVFHLFYTMRSTRDARAATMAAGGFSASAWPPAATWSTGNGIPRTRCSRPILAGMFMRASRSPATSWLSRHEDHRRPGGRWLDRLLRRHGSAEEEADAACIAVARSKDLIHWEQSRLPFTETLRRSRGHDVFPLGGKWWMTCLTSHGHGNRGGFSDPNVVRGTIVAVADKPEGPYREPAPGYAILGGDLTAGNTVSTVEFEGKATPSSKKASFFRRRWNSTFRPKAGCG